MKKTFTTFLTIATLGSLTLPMAAFAQDLGAACTSKISNYGNSDNCLTQEEMQSMTYVVLEEAFDTPDTEPNNGNQTTRKCIRYTEILKCAEDGGKIKKQKINQALLKANKCPDIPDSGTDQFGQYFDCQEVMVIVSDPAAGGTGILQVYVSLIYRWAAGIVGIIAVLIIVVSGIQISMANGEPSKVDEAKTRIMQSLGGIALLFFASAILYMINPTFFKAPSYSSPETSTAEPANESKTTP